MPIGLLHIVTLPRPVQYNVSGIKTITKSVFRENRFESRATIVGFAFEHTVV